MRLTAKFAIGLATGALLVQSPAYAVDAVKLRPPQQPLLRAQLSAEDIFWQTIQSSNDPALFRAYLDQVASGKFAGTYKAIAEIKLSTLSAGAPAPQPSPPSQPSVHQAAPASPAPSATEPAAPKRSTAGAEGVQSPQVDACDRAAAAPGDSDKPADIPGVTYTRIDTSAAIQACRKAIGLPGAPRRVHFQLGRALAKSGNIPDAVLSYQKAVELGHAGAMYNMADFLSRGVSGVKRDTGLALSLYERAAGAGVNEALVQLGAIYAEGRGIRRSLPKALEYYQKAVEARTPGAFTNLGVLYFNGRGVARSKQKACELWREGSSLGDEAAAGNLRRQCRFARR